MANKDFNPYTPPNPLEIPKPPEAPKPPVQSAPPVAFSGGEHLRAGTVFWWLYFALCSYAFGGNLLGFVRSILIFQVWNVVLSQVGLALLMQGLALIGLLCYLRRVPLFHSFFWGLVCLGWLALSIYVPLKAISYLSRHDALIFNVQVFSFVAVYLLRLPELYALWRYSSSSSSIWKNPRIQWKTLGRKVVNAILQLRRA
jgi:hypothetical protein